MNYYFFQVLIYYYKSSETHKLGNKIIAKFQCNSASRNAYFFVVIVTFKYKYRNLNVCNLMLVQSLFHKALKPFHVLVS